MKSGRTVSPEESAARGGAQEPGPTLPPWKAFVVQFSDETKTAGGIFSGRIEHLNSAHRARFESPEELLAVLQRMLEEFAQR